MTHRRMSNGHTNFRRPTWSPSSASCGSPAPAAARPQGRNRGVGEGAPERARCNSARAPGGYCQRATVQQWQFKSRLPAVCGAVSLRRRRRSTSSPRLCACRRPGTASMCWPPTLPKRRRPSAAFGTSRTRTSRSGVLLQSSRRNVPARRQVLAAVPRAGLRAAANGGGARNATRQLDRSGAAAPGGGRARRRQL
jgi:hypothetical protein